MNKRVCPLERAKKLNSWWRKLVHPPSMLKRYIKPGAKVLDFGCGPGMFSIAMAKMGAVVIAADIQQGMLDMLKSKIENSKTKKNIRLVKIPNNSIGIKEKVDFILAFFVVHEVPDQEKFFKEAHALLNKNGLLFMAEPSHRVSKEEFKEEIAIAKKQNFKIKEKKRIFRGYGLLLKK